MKIPSLAAGSRTELLFRIRAPGLDGKPKADPAGTPAIDGNISTGQKKRILVTASQVTASGRQVVSSGVEIEYTTMMWLYLACGLLGVVLGHLAKVVGEDRKKLRDSAVFDQTRASARAVTKFTYLLGWVYVERMPSFLTLLVIGFGGLLVLSADGIPAASWHQSIALGIGLAVVSDDKLLAKVTGGVP